MYMQQFKHLWQSVLTRSEWTSFHTNENNTTTSFHAQYYVTSHRTQGGTADQRKQPRSRLGKSLHELVEFLLEER